MMGATRILSSARGSVAVAAVVVCMAATLRADVIYSGTSDGPWQLGASPNRLAQTFSTGAAPMTLDSVSVWVRNANSGNSSASPGTLTLSLFATDGSFKPTGSSLLTIVNSQSIDPWGDGWVTGTNLNHALTANTRYAVVFAASGGSTISWKYNNTNPIVSSISPTPTFYDWQSTDNGATWSNASPTTGFNMVVNASTSPVPEVDLNGLGGVVALVVGTLGWLERRRLRAA